MKKTFPAAGLCLFLCGLVAFAAFAADSGADRNVVVTRAVGYSPNVSSAAYRGTLSGADATTYDDSTITALDKILCEGYDTVNVHGRFSVASSTVVATVIRYDRSDVIVGVAEFTLTAKATDTFSSLYFSNATPVDTQGIEYVRIKIAAPSGGTVALWAGVS